ncbi:MAG: penicillin-binding protein 2, partial [Bacteroidia bacterium]|nr:penicillin-binding protein 2 [Bacteroidia bacterium]
MNSNNIQRLVISAIFVSIAFIYIVRLFFVQVVDESYKLSANNNVVRQIIDYPVRGLIYDRTGKLLVYNEAAYDVMVIPNQLQEMDTTEFCSLINISKDYFNKNIRKAKRYSSKRPSIFLKQLSSKDFASLQEKLHKYKGFYVQPRTVRKYPYKIAPHALGYIGEVNDKIINKLPYYKSGDYIGISGIEQSYEQHLRGKRGLKYVLVDVFGREKGRFEEGKYDT